jgi:hypothetical protein
MIEQKGLLSRVLMHARRTDTNLNSVGSALGLVAFCIGHIYMWINRAGVFV